MTNVAKITDFDAGEEFEGANYEMRYPFKFMGRVVSKIEIRCPTGKDLDKHIKGNNPKDEFAALVADLTGLDADHLAKMRAVDRSALFALVGNMIGDA